MAPTKGISPKHKRIIDLLTAEDLTTRQAAERLGVSASSVWYACRRYKLKTLRAHNLNRIPELSDPTWLRQKVTVEGLTYQEVANLLGCSRQYVQQRVDAFGIPRAEDIRPKHQRIIDLLTAEDLTIRQAAERLGVSISSVNYACSKYKLKYLNAHNLNRIPELMDREWLYQKVTVEGLSYQEVADLLGCSRQYVHQRVDAFGIPRAGEAGPVDSTKLAGRPSL